MAKIFFLVATCICAVVAEPPVNTYLPAAARDSAQSKAIDRLSSSRASQYRAPLPQYGTPGLINNEPSTQYGAPTSPSSVYGTASARVPSASYGTPSTQYKSGVGSPSGQYGAPSFRNNPPSAQYGAPRTPSSVYGTPSARVPSSTYGAPGSGFGGRANVPSSTYGTPATRYTGVTNDAVITDAADLVQGGYGQSAPGNGYGSAGYGQTGSETGYGQGGYDDQSVPAKYDFNYEVNAPEYNVEFGHEESRDGDNTQGSYHVLLPDGRRQLVEYTADLEGYKPRISYQDTGNAFGAGNYGSAGGYGGSAGGYDSGSASGYSATGSSGATGYSASRNHGGYPSSGSGSGPY